MSATVSVSSSTLPISLSSFFRRSMFVLRSSTTSMPSQMACPAFTCPNDCFSVLMSICIRLHSFLALMVWCVSSISSFSSCLMASELSFDIRDFSPSSLVMRVCSSATSWMCADLSASISAFMTSIICWSLVRVLEAASLAFETSLVRVSIAVSFLTWSTFRLLASLLSFFSWNSLLFSSCWSLSTSFSSLLASLLLSLLFSSRFSFSFFSLVFSLVSLVTSIDPGLAAPPKLGGAAGMTESRRSTSFVFFFSAALSFFSCTMAFSNRCMSVVCWLLISRSSDTFLTLSASNRSTSPLSLLTSSVSFLISAACSLFTFTLAAGGLATLNRSRSFLSLAISSWYSLTSSACDLTHFCSGSEPLLTPLGLSAAISLVEYM
mmetsp:Transcript_21018/g.39352  ORF Transcript_21018/g.39352 Transcript_21018/m.39352 type:complete len:378 (+) Transcript_21018:807-1940(+)